MVGFGERVGLTRRVLRAVHGDETEFVVDLVWSGGWFNQDEDALVDCAAGYFKEQTFFFNFLF